MQKTPEDQLPHPSRIAIRVNSHHTPGFERDIVSIVRTPFFFPLRSSGIETQTWLLLPLLAHYSRRSDARAAQNSFGGGPGNRHGRDGGDWTGKGNHQFRR
jgi:hypothetical protein